MADFKLGDIVKAREVVGHGATMNWRYLVLGEGKWEGFVSVFCFKADDGWIGKTFSFASGTLEVACD